MKPDIHPDYVECEVTCACGNGFTTRATIAKIHVDVCAECHPFFTGQQRLIDTAGQVDRFERRRKKARATA